MPSLSRPIIEGLTDHYNIEHRIGKGGFGTVYRASHNLTGDRVAVKLIDKENSTLKDDLHRVRTEIDTLKTIRHPNICKIYKAGENSRYIYIIMEYCSGGELFDYLVSKDKLSENEARRILIEILKSVDYLHVHNIAHRDLKPENVLLDYNNNIKLIDFGLCSKSENIDSLATACGSFAYAAPELHLGKSYDGRLADIWSLGCILYALLTGHLPFEGNDNDIRNKALLGRYEEPKWLSAGAKNILKCMLTLNPKDRLCTKELLTHTWCLADIDHGILPMEVTTYSDSENEALDEEVLKIMAAGLGYTLESLEANIRKWDYESEDVAIYCMLCDRKRICGPSFESIPLQTNGIRPQTQHNLLKIKKSLEEEFSKEDSCDNNRQTPVAPPRKYHASMEGGLDDINLLEFASPKSKANEVRNDEFARPRIPSPKKQRAGDGVAFLPGSIGPARSADSGLNEYDAPKTPARERWMTMEDKTPVRSYPSPSPSSRRKILGSLERGIDKVRSILTPRSTKAKKLKTLKYNGRKEAFNITYTAASDADCVLEQLKVTLENMGATYKDNGYCVVGKWQERSDDGNNALTGRQVKFELEVVLVSEEAPLAGVGIRRKRVNGDALMYKHVVQQIINLTPVCKLPTREPKVATVPLQTMV